MEMVETQAAQNIRKITIDRPHEWNPITILLFRFAFIFFILQAVPFDWKYYRFAFEINWTDLTIRDVFYLAKYTPTFFSSYDLVTPATQLFLDWIIIGAIAIGATAIWTYRDKRNKNYDNLYYVLTVILRYRLAFALAAYAWIKVFPLQQPYPSLSLLNTNYGDLSDWKIVILTYGVGTSYEVLLGFVELLAALLLLYRKSASLGAALAIGFTGNVLLSNLAYNGGESIYCLYLLGMAAVIFANDAYRYYSLLVLVRPTLPNYYQPVFPGQASKVRILFKSIYIACVFFLCGYLAYHSYANNPIAYPHEKGLPNVAGLYDVSEFKINGLSLPYAFVDSTRWQNVVFEEWPTISVGVNRKIIPDHLNTEEIFKQDRDRIFEATGSTGRSFYSYEADTINHVLTLTNRNRHYPNDQLTLHYERVGQEKMKLWWLNENHDSLHVVLNKVPKIYILNESYQQPKNRSVFD